jgi:hypothetical protein
MNILFLKTLAMDPKTLTYHSPQRKDFTWQEGIMVAQCEKCAPEGTIGLDCHCGIYGSPNPEALKEYAVHPTSFVALLNAYGRVDVWTAPDDIWQCYVIRAWAARVVAIVAIKDEDTIYDILNGTDDRSMAAIAAITHFDVPLYPWLKTREMIEFTWEEHLQINPYMADTDDPWRAPNYDWRTNGQAYCVGNVAT